MKFTPLHDWVLIRTGEPSEKSAGGIIIPDTAQEKAEEGEVLAVGAGRFVEGRDSNEKVEKKTFVKASLGPSEQSCTTNTLPERWRATMKGGAGS